MENKRKFIFSVVVALFAPLPRIIKINAARHFSYRISSLLDVLTNSIRREIYVCSSFIFLSLLFRNDRTVFVFFSVPMIESKYMIKKNILIQWANRNKFIFDVCCERRNKRKFYYKNTAALRLNLIRFQGKKKYKKMKSFWYSVQPRMHRTGIFASFIYIFFIKHRRNVSKHKGEQLRFRLTHTLPANGTPWQKDNLNEIIVLVSCFQLITLSSVSDVGIYVCIVLWGDFQRSVVQIAQKGVLKAYHEIFIPFRPYEAIACLLNISNNRKRKTNIYKEWRKKTKTTCRTSNERKRTNNNKKNP